jgi:hypothetical protein
MAGAGCQGGKIVVRYGVIVMERIVKCPGAQQRHCVTKSLT